jgi:hypothetical protein
MFAITSQPEEISLTGLPLNFQVASDREADDYRIMALPLPGDPDAPVEILPIGESTSVQFNLCEYFQQKRISEYSDLNAAIHLDACKNATIQFEEFYGNPPAGSNTIEWTGLIMGGNIPKWMQYSFNKTYESFVAYLSAKKPFLTFYPRYQKKVFPEQPERLYYLNRLDELPASIKLLILVTFDDLTSEYCDPNRSISVNPDQVISFATGYNQLGLGTWMAANHPTKKVKYYSAILQSDSVGISELYIYEPDFSDQRNTKYIIFKNSLSGYDCLPCNGEVDETTEVERYTANRIADVNLPGRLHREEYLRDEFEIVKVNTGYLQSWEKDWLNELYISDEVYEVVDGERRQILIRSKQLDRTLNKFEPSSVEIEYERLFLAK